MRYVEITHTYVLPVPAEDVSVIEPIAREGMSFMEGFMLARAANIRNLHSDWKLMPKEYTADEIEITPAKMPEKFTDTPRERDRIESLAAIEADADYGISFVEDVMGQTPKGPPHPWDQGLRVLPQGHELFNAETEALHQAGRLCRESDPLDLNMECVAVRGHPAGQHIWRTRGVDRKKLTP
jgi:hypothetical protein